MFLTPARSVLAVVLFSGCHVQASEPPTASDPMTSTEQGLLGHIKSVRVEESSVDGAPRTLIERTIFGHDGRAIESAHAFSASEKLLVLEHTSTTATET